MQIPEVYLERQKVEGKRIEAQQVRLPEHQAIGDHPVLSKLLAFREAVQDAPVVDMAEA